jgi:hypothetical protein
VRKPSDEDMLADVEWALDEVARQLAASPQDELIETDDVAWSLNAPTGRVVYVEVESRRRTGASLVVTLFATSTGWHPLRRRQCARREAIVRLR